MSITFSLGDRLVGSDQPPFIIAEMSGNHNQSLDRALELVDAAAQAGAHAVKLQTYTADTITLNVREGEFTISDEKVYGRATIFTTCTARPTRHGSGTRRSWNGPRRMA